MAHEEAENTGDSVAQESHQAFRIRLPGFVAEGQEVGLGEIIKRATSSAGVKPCGGCLQRAAALNNWVRFTH
ncbi:hypothetical protein [Mycolicibacterium sp.]|uniref:hypothetical protein n=1 Tax=Mycolicibacterium sp. TaxID=2320850 RepID=UPI0037C88B72